MKLIDYYNFAAMNRKINFLLFLIFSLSIASISNLSANSKSNLKSTVTFLNNSELTYSFNSNSQKIDIPYFKETTESDTSFIFIEEIINEEVEDCEENLILHKSKYFILKNNSCFSHKNKIENTLLITKEEVLFQNFIEKSSFTRLYKQFQVYRI